MAKISYAIERNVQKDRITAVEKKAYKYTSFLLASASASSFSLSS